MAIEQDSDVGNVFYVIQFAMYPQDPVKQVLITAEEYALLHDYAPIHGYAVCDEVHELRLDGTTVACIEALQPLLDDLEEE